MVTLQIDIVGVAIFWLGVITGSLLTLFLIFLLYVLPKFHSYLQLIGFYNKYRKEIREKKEVIKNGDYSDEQRRG